MAGNNRQRKSSFSFFFVFNLFKSKKAKGGHCDACDACDVRGKVWPSDADKGLWGVADPGIDKKAAEFIEQNKKRVSDLQLDSTAGTA